jgi:uncharacterized protein (TIGR00661 family)
LAKPPRILVAPLNWGLGHATRCIPIIHSLQKQGVDVLIGSDGEALQLLKLAFPELPSVELPSYNIRYRYANMFMNIAPQMPKLFKALALERRFLASIIQSHKIDALISDNRYGLQHPQIPCVFITHQLNIRISNPIISRWVNAINHRLMRKFQACWVPDFEEAPGLSGSLAHPFKPLTDKIKDIQYIGPLSRLETPILDILLKSYDIVAILSGPEPQRSYLEKKLLAEMEGLPLKCLLVRGKPNATESLQSQSNSSVEICHFLDAPLIAWHIQSAGLLVARSGYSTIMDMAKTGCSSALLIPTPGQTEQEYLAEQLAKEGLVQQQSQQKLNLKMAWDNRLNSKGFKYEFDNQLLDKVVNDFVDSIKK